MYWAAVGGDGGAISIAQLHQTVVTCPHDTECDTPGHCVSVSCPRHGYIATSDSYTHRRPALPALLFQILHLYRMAEPRCNTVI